MSYTYYIDFGSGYTEVNPFTNGCAVERKKEDGKIYSKDILSGDLVFYKTEYNLLKLASATNKALPFKVEYNSLILWEGLIDLAGKYNVREKRCELAAIPIDPFALLEGGLNEKSDIYLRDQTKPFDTKVIHPTPYAQLPFFKTNMPDLVKTCYSCPLELVIEYLLKKADDTILFDSDSFKYFNDSIYWKKLAVCSTRSAFDQSTLSKTDVSLSQLLDYFANNFEIYWTLEKIGNDYYFRFKHISEILFTLGTSAAHDLTTYRDVNWSENKQISTFDNTDRFWKIARRNFAILPDFVGVDIVFPQLEKIGSIKEVTNQIVTDVESMYTDNEAVPVSDNSLLLLANELIDDVFLCPIRDFNSLSGAWFVSYDTIGPEVLFVQTNDVRIDSIYSNIGSAVLDGIKNFYLFELAFDIVITGDVKSVKCVIEYFTWQKERFEFTASKSGNFTTFMPFVNPTMIFEIETHLSGVGTVTVTSTQLTFYKRLGYYRVLKGTGIIRGDVKYNMPLAQSYIDSIAGAFNKYTTPALINNVSTPVTLKKIKRVENINVNMRELLINFDYLVKTTLGNIEPTLLKIDLDKGIANISGKL